MKLQTFIRFTSNKPFLTGLLALIVNLIITLLLANQQQYIAREKAENELVYELNVVKDRFRTLLNNNIATAKAMALIYEEYGIPSDFNHLASQLMKSNPYVDGIQLTRKGETIRVFPYEENKVVIGFDLFKNPLRKKEALYAATTGQVVFAGPYDLIQGGGKAVIGRIPVYHDNRFAGFSVVLTKLSTIHSFLNLDTGLQKKFNYQLSKINPLTNKNEFFFHDLPVQKAKNEVRAFIPEGGWTLHVSHHAPIHHHRSLIAFIYALGFFVSLFIALETYRKLREPEKLQKIIAQTSAKLASDEQYYRTLIETSSDAIVLINQDGKVIYQTPSTQSISGYSLREIQQQNGIEIIHPEDRDYAIEQYTASFNHPGKVVKIQHRLRHKDGHYISLEGAYRNLLNDPNVNALVLTYTDITHRIFSDQNLSKINRELSLLNKINDIIQRTLDETELINEVCKCIVISGGYKLAWVSNQPGQSDPIRMVNPISAFGETDYMTNLKINLSDPLLSKGPTAQVLLHGKIVITNNVHKSENFQPWLENATRYGIAASIVLPLKFNNSHVTGTLNIYSKDTEAFGEEEVRILERVANNISLAVHHIRNRKDKDLAQFLLNERVKELTVISMVNRLLQNESLSVDSLLQRIVEIIPKGWQFPEICQAQIVHGGKTYRSVNYKEPVVAISSAVHSIQDEHAILEVGYSVLHPVSDNDPFFVEERELIKNLSEIIETTLNKRFQQQALVQSEANLKSVFDHTEIGYVLLDQEFNILAFNNRIKTGYAQETGIRLSLHTNFIHLLIPERQESSRKLFEEVMHTSKPLEYDTHFTNNGITNYFRISLNPVISKGVSIGLCLSAYDITTTKNQEIERKKIIQDILQRNRDLEQFAYIVAHNVRAPLATLLGLSNLLNMDVSSDDKLTAIHGIKESAEKLDMVLEDLNQILRVKRDIQTLRVQLSLEKILKEVLSSLRFNIEKSGAVIEYDFGNADDVYSVKSYLHSIFLNLITNSIKYARPGLNPRISIKAEKQDKAVCIRFSDNGIGIDLERYRNDLFGLYKRFNTSAEGKGLGLYMVKTQVEGLNGTIDVESTPGVGTTFIVTLNMDTNVTGTE